MSINVAGASPGSQWREWLIRHTYADHNSSKAVQKELACLLELADAGRFVLNVGSGNRRIHPQVKNLDVCGGENVDYTASAESIPVGDDAVDAVITQEVFEHIPNPRDAMREIYRVLKPGGLIYFQVPFIIGFHSGPSDYWRFTTQGIAEFIKQSNFELVRTGVTAGSAFGYYRVSVEFFAIMGSLPSSKLYIPLKGLFSLLLYPIRWLDPLAQHSRQNDRVAGGFYCIAKKPKNS